MSDSGKAQLQRTSSKSVAALCISGNDAARRHPMLRLLAGRKPIFTPRMVPLDLLFFRRVFSMLHKQYGDKHGEVPVSVFQRGVVRLFRVLGMDMDFDAEEYDVDGSGSVGWYEFVSCWRNSQICVSLSGPERVFLAMEDPGTCFLGQLANTVITVLIFVSCVLFIISTLPDLRHAPCEGCEPEQFPVFDVLEAVCVAVFTLEYLVRALTAPFARTELLDYEQILGYVARDAVSMPSRLVRLLRFIVQPMNMIDIFVIAPFYLELMLDGMDSSNFTVLRVLRLTRLFRLVKLGKYFEALEIIIRVFRRSTKMFNVLGVYLVLGVCFSSAAMYYVETGDWDPEQKLYVRTSHDGEKTPTPFRSIPHAFWWCVVTFTTVGYGDVFPVTVMGKLVATCTMVVGILVLAMPISVISMNFTDVWADWNEEKRLEAESREQDVISVNQALEGMGCRTRLLVELFDDFDGREEPEFLGEVEWCDLPVDSPETAGEEKLLPLRPNIDKRPSWRTSGSLLTGYTWHPAEPTLSSEGGVNFQSRGKLEVRIERAQGLQRSDWKKQGLRDVFAVVRCWPRPPDGAGAPPVAATFQTRTIRGSLDPVWEETPTFEFDWSQECSMKAKSAATLKTAAWTRSLSLSELAADSQMSPKSPTSPAPKGPPIREMVERQGEDLKQLAGQVAELRTLLLDLRAELSARRAAPAATLPSPLARLVPLAPLAAAPGIEGEGREEKPTALLDPPAGLPGSLEAGSVGGSPCR